MRVEDQIFGLTYYVSWHLKNFYVLGFRLRDSLSWLFDIKIFREIYYHLVSIPGDEK